MLEIVRHRLLKRRPVGSTDRAGRLDQGDVILECGHIMPREMANRKTGWVHRTKPRVYCQVCAMSPHPITNPEAWAKMMGLERQAL